MGIEKEKFIKRLNEYGDVITLNQIVFLFSDEYYKESVTATTELSHDPYHSNEVCNNCNKPVHGDYQYCPYCGKLII